MAILEKSICAVGEERPVEVTGNSKGTQYAMRKFHIKPYISQLNNTYVS